MLSIKLNECEILSIDDLIAVNKSLIEALSNPPELGDKNLHAVVKQITIEYVNMLIKVKKEFDLKEMLEHD